MIPQNQNDTYQILYSLVFLFNISNLYSGNVFCFRVSANLIRSVKNWCCCGFSCIILYIFKCLIEEWGELWSIPCELYEDKTCNVIKLRYWATKTINLFRKEHNITHVQAERWRSFCNPTILCLLKRISFLFCTKTLPLPQEMKNISKKV